MGSTATGPARWEKTDPPSESEAKPFPHPAATPPKATDHAAEAKERKIAGSANGVLTEKLEAVARPQPKTPVKVE